MRNLSNKLIILILSVVLVFNLIGCSRLQSNNKSQSKKNGAESIPNNLLAIDDKVQNLTDKLKQIKQMQQKKSESNHQKSGSQDQSSGGSNKDNSQKKLEKLQSEVDSSIQELNMSWNDFEVTAKDKAATEEAIEKFETNLNLATEAVKKQKTTKALININKLNMNLVPFLKLYETKSPVELKQLKYYTQEIMFLEDNWPRRKENIMQSKSLIPTLKQEMKEKKLINKLKNSTLDLEKVIEQQKKDLVKVKGKIMLENIKKLRKQ